MSEESFIVQYDIPAAEIQEATKEQLDKFVSLIAAGNNEITNVSIKDFHPGAGISIMVTVLDYSTCSAIHEVDEFAGIMARVAGIKFDDSTVTISGHPVDPMEELEPQH